MNQIKSSLILIAEMLRHDYFPVIPMDEALLGIHTLLNYSRKAQLQVMSFLKEELPEGGPHHIRVSYLLGLAVGAILTHNLQVEAKDAWRFHDVMEKLGSSYRLGSLGDTEDLQQINLLDFAPDWMEEEQLSFREVLAERRQMEAEGKISAA